MWQILAPCTNKRTRGVEFKHLTLDKYDRKCVAIFSTLDIQPNSLWDHLHFHRLSGRPHVVKAHMPSQMPSAAWAGGGRPESGKLQVGSDPMRRTCDITEQEKEWPRPTSACISLDYWRRHNQKAHHQNNVPPSSPSNFLGQCRAGSARFLPLASMESLMLYLIGARIDKY